MTQFWYYTVLTPEELAAAKKAQAEWERKAEQAWGKGWRERSRRPAGEEGAA